MRRAGVLSIVLLSLAAAPARAALTIYSSLPLQGSSADQTEAIVQAEQLALAQAGGTAAGQPVQLVSLDDSTAAAGSWDEARCAANARKAAADPGTILYLGDFNSGCSKISMPILNQAGIGQISPSNTYVGLTRAGGEKGEPAIYRPSGKLSYARVAPPDDLQAAAIVAELKRRGLTRVFLTSDGDEYGRYMRAAVAGRAHGAGIHVVGQATATSARGAGAATAALARTNAQALVYSGVTANGAPAVVNQAVARRPGLAVIGVDGVTENAFTRALSGAARKRWEGSVAGGLAADYGPAAMAFDQAFSAQFGAAPDIYSYYGDEAMALGLDAINRAGAMSTDRSAVITQLFATKDRDGLIGRYSIDKNGDPTQGTFSFYRSTPGGTLVRDHAVRVGS